MKIVTVWGLAAGRGSTKDAARGALTCRDYPEDNIPQADWLKILYITGS